jgi:DNA repair exonuclease SbcCD ATPase subunit
VSREQASYRRNLDEDLLCELEESRLKRLNQVTEHKNNISESTQEAADASSNLIRAKQNYIKVLGEVEVVRQKLSVAVANLHALKHMSDAERKKKKDDENKYSMGRLFSAFERTPEDECKHQSKKLKKLEGEMVIKQQEIEEKKTLLLEKIQKKESFYTQVVQRGHSHISLLLLLVT